MEKWLDRYVELLRLEHRPFNCIRNRRYYLKKWIDFAQGPGSRENALKFLDQWQNPRTRCNVWGHLRGFTKFLADEGVCPDWTLKVHVKARKKMTRDIIKAYEVRAMLEACDDSWLGRRNFTIITLLAQSGARRDEIRPLRVDDVDLENAQFRARVKAGEVEIFHLTPPAVEALEKWIPMVPGNYLFPSARRKKDRPVDPSSFRDIVNNIAKDAGIERTIHPHMFRHYVGQKVYDSGFPLDTVQKVLHHKSLASTMIYAKLGDREAAEALDQVLGRKRENRAA